MRADSELSGPVWLYGRQKQRRAKLDGFRHGQRQRQAAYVGGVVGRNNGGTVENCHNTATVSESGSGTDIRIGGVVGWNDKGTVKNCSNTGKVSGEGSVGGVVGENSGIGTVANCHNNAGDGQRR